MTLYLWIKIRDGLGIHSPDNSIEMHMKNISEQKHWCKAAGPLPYVLGGLFVFALYREFWEKVCKMPEKFTSISMLVRKGFQMYKLGLEKAEEPEIKLPTFVESYIEKAREFLKNICFCFIDHAKAFDCVEHKKL